MEKVERESELKKLGDRLKYFRNKKGFRTAEDAAYSIGIQRSQYSRYEAGQNITYLTLTDLLSKLNVSHREFFAEGFE